MAAARFPFLKKFGGGLNPHIALLAANLIWGANYTIAKFVMPYYVQPYGFVFLRLLGANIVFWILHAFIVKEKIQKEDLPRFILCGLFGAAINQLATFKGLSLTVPVNASLIMITTPILVMVFSILGKQDKFTWYKGVGLLLGVSGALYTIAGKEFNFTSNTALGDMFIFLNATSYAIYLIIVKPLAVKYHPITLMKWVFFFGFFPVSIIGYKQFLEIPWGNMPFSIYVAIFYVVLFVTCLAFLLSIFAVRKVQPSVVGVYIYLQPIFATIVAVLFNADVFNLQKLIAALLIFSGIYMVSLYRPTHFKKQKI